MKVGYARTSTVEQEAGFKAQIKELKAAGCQRTFQEQTSSVGPRKELEAVLDFVREGDSLVVTKLDRLARSVPNLVDITRELEAKGASLVVLDMTMDTSTPQGELMLNVIGAIAQFERKLMLERQREGIAKAKAEGKYKGRKPTARAKSGEVLALREEGVGATEIAKRLGIGRASVYRIIEDAQAAA
jgi:DNA invertase Pin-like site-specific DNA recombinase